MRLLFQRKNYHFQDLKHKDNQLHYVPKAKDCYNKIKMAL